MTEKANKEFIEWVNSVEKSHGWTDNKWTTKAGISASVLSRARQGIIPKWDACLALANAAHLSPITAFRKAGLLPPGDEKINFKDWEHLLDQISQEDRDEIFNALEFKVNKKIDQSNLKTLKPRNNQR